MNKLKIALLSAILMVVSLIVGCGGSGGASASGGSIQAFATDDLHTGYDHVWVKVLKVDLNSGSTSSNIFDETATGGRLIDLRSLRDATGPRFLMLCAQNVPAGSYTGATVTLDKSVSIVATGDTTATEAVFADLTGGTKVLTTTFRAPVDSSTNPRVVLDFDLAKWELAAGVVSATGGAFIKHGEETGITDSARHQFDDYNGLVSGLSGTAPTQTFTLTRGTQTLNVSTDASTVIFNNDGSANPSLSNAKKLQVTGLFDISTNTLKAVRIKVEVADEREDEAHAVGTASSFDLTAFTLQLKIDRAKGFLPGTTLISVLTDSNTKFFGPSGLQLTKDEFFALLVAGTTKVEAEGTYATETGLAAKRLKVEGDSSPGDDGEHHHQAEVRGAVSDLNLEAHIFDLTVREWAGASLTQNQVIRVKFSELPGGIENGSQVDVKGIYAVEIGTLLSTSVRLARD